MEKGGRGYGGDDSTSDGSGLVDELDDVHIGIIKVLGLAS
jgi:hypothetical protein